MPNINLEKFYLSTSVEQYEILFSSAVQTEDFAEYYARRLLDLPYD